MPTAPSTGKGESIQRRWVKTRHVLRQALLNFLAEDSLMVSGSIAYHSLLAIFPLLLLLLGLSGLYIRRFELAGHLSVVLQRYLPVRTDIIMQNLVGISRAYGRIGLISFLLLLWSSSGVFLPLEKALNRAWEVAEERTWWRSRLLALEMAFVVGCLILIAAAFVGVEIFFRQRLEALLGPSLHSLVVFLYHLLTAISSFALALLMFVVLFERLPNRPMHLRQRFARSFADRPPLGDRPLAFHPLPSFLQLPPGLRIDWRYGISYDLGIYILRRHAFRSPGIAHPLRISENRRDDHAARLFPSPPSSLSEGSAEHRLR